VQIDKKALEGLLSLNDRQLLTMVNRLLLQSGIDPAGFNIDPKDIASIRSAISGASDSDLQRVVDQYEANQRSHGGRK
jgi:hypothetical protein